MSMDHTKLTEELLPWAEALLVYEMEGEVDDLVALLRSDESMPAPARYWISKVFTGETKRGSRRGKSNATLSWAARKQLKSGLGKVYRNSEIVLSFTDEIADEIGIEPIEIKQKMEKVRRDAMSALVTRYDMSESGIRKIVNVALSADLGKMLCGEYPEDWAPNEDWQKFTARHAERRQERLSEALEIYRDGRGAFDPMSADDPISQ